MKKNAKESLTKAKSASKEIGQDLRKIGLGLMAAGWISYFIPSSANAKTTLLILAGTVIWLLGIALVTIATEA